MTVNPVFAQAFVWLAALARQAVIATAILIGLAGTAFAQHTVTGVSPTTGPVTGGTNVTITGTGFTGATSAQIGGPLDNFVVVNDTTITGTTRARSGVNTLSVTVTKGTGASLSSAFTYTAVLPTITNVSPNSGPIAGGTPITITGTALTGANNIRIGGVAVTNTVVVNATTVTARTAANTLGSKDLELTTGSGTINAGSAFTYVANGSAPVVSSMFPVGGTTAGGTAITIKGVNFTGATSATIGGAAVTSFAVVNDTTITGVSPAGSAGARDVVVNAPTGSGTGPGFFTYGAPGTFRVLGVSPATGPVTGGTNVTVSGTGFTGATAGFLGGPLDNFVVVNDTTITGTTRARSSSGLFGVTIQQSDGSQASLFDSFVYTPVAPTVTGVSPNTGPVAGGTIITITGTALTNASAVTVGGVSATNIVINSATQITARTPAGIAGARDVNVTTGSGTAVGAGLFTYQANGTAPIVTRVNPFSGTAAGGTPITITGVNFTGVTGVTIGGAAATSVVVVNDTTITAITPAGTAGARDIVVTHPTNGSGTGTGFYTYLSAATFSVGGITPNTGPVTGGTNVTINGTGFTGATSASVGSTLDNFVVVNDTTITGTTRARGSSGLFGAFVVKPVAGQVGVFDVFTFTPVLPTVTNVSPNSGPDAGGTNITITGTAFNGVSAVTVGGVAATNVVFVNSTTITATTPAGTAGARAVAVTTPSGTSTVTGTFTYVAPVPPPTVTAVSPNQGSVAGGTPITITGTNLLNASSVTVGGTAATSVVVVNATTITAVTPAGTAGARDVVVVTPGGTGTGTGLFTYAVLPATHFVVSAPANATAGTAFNVTVTARDVTNATATGYSGTVQFSSTDGTATLPANTTLTNGTGTFPVTLRTAGSRTITATDTVTATITGTSGAIAVAAGAAASMSLKGGSSQTSPVSNAFATPISVLVQDAFNNPVSGASVTFTGPGSGASVTFSPGNTNVGSASTNASGIASITPNANATAGGPYTVVASLGALTPVNFSLTNTATTTTSLVSSANPSVPGQSVDFTATVSSAGGTPTGSVTFFDGATSLGTVALAGGQAVLSTAALSVGPHSITATYAGTTVFGASTSNTVSQTVNQASSTTSVVSSLNPSNFGQSVTLTATVANASIGGATPTGTVNFFDDLNFLGSGTISGGQATLTTSALTGGLHPITAVYVGDTNFISSTSPTVNQTVNALTQTISFTQPANQTFTTGGTLALTATGGASGNPVTFSSTTTGVCTVSGNTVSFVTAGLCSITANQAGTVNYTAATPVTRSFTIQQAATTASVASSLNPSTFGQSVTFTATVTSVGGTPTGTVTFKDGATTLGSGTLSGGQATLSTSALSTGGHSITVEYAGDTNFSAHTSSPLTQTVNKAATSTSVSSSLNPSVFGQSVTFTATVTSGVGTPTGTVTFKDGATSLGSAALSGAGQASLSTSALSPGPHSITAEYNSDANFEASTSNTLTQVVGKIAQTIAFVQPANQTFTPGGIVALSATGGGSGNPVVFSTNSPLVCTVTESTAAIAGAGTCSITANQAGNATHDPAPAVTRTFAINQASTTIGLTASSSGALLNQSITLTANVLPNIAPGSVTFFDGATPICSNVALSGGSATCNASFGTAGAKSLTATYNGSVNYAGSTSGQVSVTITDQRFQTTAAIGQFFSRRNDLLLSIDPNWRHMTDRLQRFNSGGQQGSSFQAPVQTGLLASAFGASALPASIARFGGPDTGSRIDDAWDSASGFYPETAGDLRRRDMADLDRISFGTSLSAIKELNSGLRGSLAANAGSTGARDATSRFDVWMQGTYVNFGDDRTLSDSDGHIGVIAAGADYVFTPWLLAGVMGQFDKMKEVSALRSSRMDSEGWMAGPYATVRLSPSLYLQARGAWGRSENDVSPFMTYTDSFQSERWLVSAAMTGSWSDRNWRFTPSASLAYIEDVSEAYRDTFGVLIPSVSASLGQFKAEPEVSYRHLALDGTVIEPRVKGSLIWNFEHSGTASGLAGDLSGATEELRGRIEAGLSAQFVSGIQVELAGSYDGIGADELRATGLDLRVRMPLN